MNGTQIERKILAEVAAETKKREELKKALDKAKMKADADNAEGRTRIKAFQEALDRTPPKESLIPMDQRGTQPTAKDPETNTTPISRAALEGLCAKAGITMNWNDGNPIYKDPGYTPDREKAYRQAERAVLVEKARQLDEIAKKTRAQTLSPALAEKVAEANSRSFGRTVIDSVLDDMEKNLKSPSIYGWDPAATVQIGLGARSPDELYDDSLRASGASEADIAAAKKLRGMALPDIEGAAPTALELYVARLEKDLQTITGIPGVAITERWKTYFSGPPQPRRYIIHPSALTEEELKL